MRDGKTFIGDHGPVAVMQNGVQVAGAVKSSASGVGRVETESIYKADLPSVVAQGQGRQETLTGKNLVDWGSGILKSPRFEITKLPNGGFHLRVESDRIFDAFISVKLPSGYFSPGTYAISGTIVSGTSKIPNLSVQLHIVRADGKTQYKDKIAEVMESDLEYNASVQFSGRAGVLDIDFFPQIEKGTVATPYEPYCGGIPAPNPDYPIEPEFLDGASITDGTNTANLPILRALPDGSVRDKIDLRTGRIERNIIALVLDDTLTYLVELRVGISRVSLFNAQTGVFQIKPNTKAVSTHFRWLKFSSAFTEANVIQTSPSANRLWLFNDESKIPDKEAWLAFLKSEKDKGTPVKLWYHLATPIIEYIDPQILRQHPGYTQLLQRGGFAETEIEATYYKEMDFNA